MDIELQLKKLGEVEKNYRKKVVSEKAWIEQYNTKSQECKDLKEKYKGYDLEEFVRLQGENKKLVEDYKILNEQDIAKEKKIIAQAREITKLLAKQKENAIVVLWKYILEKLRW